MSPPAASAASHGPAPACAAAASLLQGPLGRALWRGSELAGSPASAWSSGFAALDAVLPGGGWPAQALSEILQPRPGVCEFRLLGPALGPALARLPAWRMPGPRMGVHLRTLHLDGR